MNRVESAIAAGRCVLVFGARALADAEVLGELRHRGAIASTVLSGDVHNPAVALGADVLAPVLTKEGGVICLIEADTIDGAGLNTLANLVQAAPHKPRLVVAARAFNPFMLPTPLRLLKFEHEKKKAKEFLQSLPISSAPAVAAVAAAAAPVAEEPKKKASGAPRIHFVGREEELAALAPMLAKGGPVALVGTPGVGRRWLLEKALSGAGLKRLPDFHVGWGCEADSLYARIAMFGEKNDDKRLADALRDPASRPAPAALAALAVETLNIPAAAEHVMVIDRLEHVLRRDGTFHRESRLEVLLKALLTSTYAARLVFISTIHPRFYREGEGVALSILPVGGLKGRELHEIFESYRVEDFPREHFGDIVNRIHGHAFATRLFAIAMRNVDERTDLLESKKFLVMSDPNDIEPLRRRIQKAVEGLPEDERKALSALAHFRLPFTTAEGEDVGVDRRLRLSLLGRGLLDAGLDEGNERTFRVHPLVASALTDRETSDFGLLEHLGNQYLERASKSEGLPKLALAQEGNRFLFEAHRIRNRMRIPYPDHDPALESLRGLVRSKKPRYDLAEQRLSETLKLDPTNTELLLMKAELLIAQKAAPEAVLAAFGDAERAAPTPEVFHQEASFHQQKASGRGKAAAALERGVAAFPGNGRLRRRLAGILVDQNRLDEAVETLKAAMEIEPMMPDTYGLLGEIHLLRGAFDAAEESLAEARRLDPDNGLHMARLGALIVSRGDMDSARRAEAVQLLEAAIQADGKNYLAHLFLGRLVLDAQLTPAVEGVEVTPDATELDRAAYLLKKAQKLDEKAALPLVELARIAILREAWAEAEGLLDRASRLEPACHEAFYARGEMLSKQGHIIPAHAEFQRALERSPRDSKARPAYEKAIAQCKVLIESGAANDLARAAEEKGLKAPEAKAVEGAKRDSSRTTRRRRGKRGEGAEGGADGVVEAHAEEAEGGAEQAPAVEEAGPDAEEASEAVDAGEGAESAVALVDGPAADAPVEAE